MERKMGQVHVSMDLELAQELRRMAAETQLETGDKCTPQDYVRTLVEKEVLKRRKKAKENDYDKEIGDED